MSHLGSHSMPSLESSLVEDIARELERRILTGEYPPEHRLRQAKLATEFGVSRMPIREALRRLEATTLIEVLPQRGAVVRMPTARDIREAYVVRAELEGLAAELACACISDYELDELRAAEQMFGDAIRQLEQAGRRRQVSASQRAAPWIAANDRFHTCLLTASRNHFLKKAAMDLHHVFPRSLTWSQLHRDIRMLRENVEEHRAIRKAVEAGDGPLARSMAHRHVVRAGELVAAWAEAR